ncbi:MAG: hypothetical protein PHS14_17150 [Elusimicrobia bacterium]|nr:hypothetical protein [Elusimicrobiota bacterium]
MKKSRDDLRGLATKLLLGAFLCARAAALHAQALISPSFLGSCGSSGMTAGAQSMIFSAPQTGAAVIMSGVDMVQSGFFGFMIGIMNNATALPGQPIVVTIVTPAGVATASLPADCVPAGTVVSGQIPVSVPAAGGSGLLSVANTAIQINSAYPPARPTSLSISYANADVSGLTPAQFIIARFDAAQNVWVPLLSSVDESNHVVRAQTGHLSLFQVMQSAPSNTVSTAKAFPNPLRPAQGHKAMAFIRLPANSRIRIYTLKGVLIRELSANASGMASWDGTNQSGASAVSGVYYMFAQGAGEARTLSVAIER